MTGASEEFGDWVAPYLPDMRRLAARLVVPGDVDDVVQDALERALRRRTTYDAARGEPRPWLLAIVADRARRHRTRTRVHDELLESASGPGRAGAGHDLDLERAVAALSGRQRLAVELYYWIGLDTRECARVLDCAEGTVRATLHQARSRLRVLLAGPAPTPLPGEDR